MSIKLIGSASDFLGRSEFFQFMGMIQSGASPDASQFMKPGWSYEVKMADNGSDRVVQLIKPDLSGNLREKIASLRGKRTSRDTLKRKVNKMVTNPNLSSNVVNMYESLKGSMPILQPTEALADREKYRPIVQELMKEYPKNHPLTAYYTLLASVMT